MQLDYLIEVSTTRGSGWVRSLLARIDEVSRLTATHPSATTDGTDLFQARRPTLAAKPFVNELNEGSSMLYK